MTTNIDNTYEKFEDIRGDMKDYLEGNYSHYFIAAAVILATLAAATVVLYKNCNGGKLKFNTATVGVCLVSAVVIGLDICSMRSKYRKGLACEAITILKSYYTEAEKFDLYSYSDTRLLMEVMKSLELRLQYKSFLSTCTKTIYIAHNDITYGQLAIDINANYLGIMSRKAHTDKCEIQEASLIYKMRTLDAAINNVRILDIPSSSDKLDQARTYIQCLQFLDAECQFMKNQKMSNGSYEEIGELEDSNEKPVYFSDIKGEKFAVDGNVSPRDQATSLSIKKMC